MTMSEQSGCESTQPTVSREKRLVVMPAGCPHLNVSMCLERYSTNSSVSCLRQVISAHERTCLPRSHCMECFYFKSAKLTHSWFNFAVSWPRENVAEIDFHQIFRFASFVKTSRKRRTSSLWHKIFFMASRKFVDDLWMGASIDTTGSWTCTNITSYTTLKCKHFRRHPARTSTLRRYATDLLKRSTG